MTCGGPFPAVISTKTSVSSNRARPFAALCYEIWALLVTIDLYTVTKPRRRT
jgi:hypothetical protein